MVTALGKIMGPLTSVSDALGPVVQGVGAYRAGSYNAAVADVEAVNAARDGAAEEARIREAARMTIGEQIAAQGSNGFQQGSGSALDALTQSQINATLDALTVRRAAAAKAMSLRAKGEIARAGAKTGLFEGLYGAASTLMRHRSDWAAARVGTTPSGSKTSGTVRGRTLPDGLDHWDRGG